MKLPLHCYASFYLKKKNKNKKEEKANVIFLRIICFLIASLCIKIPMYRSGKHTNISVGKY